MSLFCQPATVCYKIHIYAAGVTLKGSLQASTARHSDTFTRRSAYQRAQHNKAVCMVKTLQCTSEHVSVQRGYNAEKSLSRRQTVRIHEHSIANANGAWQIAVPLTPPIIAQFKRRDPRTPTQCSSKRPTLKVDHDPCACPHAIYN
jgi:hypothetical protein